MSTYLDIVEHTRARMTDWDAEFPSSARPLYRRIGKRQQQLFTLASKVNPDLFGVDAVGPLINNQVNLRDLSMAPTVNQAVGVQRVEIFDRGSSSLVARQRVNVVSVDDEQAGLPPRVTMRDYIIRGVGSDLTGVVSLCVYYPRYPDMPAFDEDGTTVIELEEAHDELLVIDLTKDLVRKTLGMDAQIKIGVQTILDAEEAEMLAQFQAEIAGFPIGQSRRFSDPANTAVR